MAKSSICVSCLRVLHKQAGKEVVARSPRPTSHSIFRPLSTTSRQLASRSQTKADSSKYPRPKSPKSAAPSATSPPPPPPSARELSSQLASSLRKSSALRSTTEPYIAYGSTEELFRACRAQCSYTIPSAHLSPPQPPPENAAGEHIGVGAGWWFDARAVDGLALPVTFSSWAQVMFAHLYCLTARLRAFPAEHAGIWHQQLIDHFFFAAEEQMAVEHQMVSRAVRNRYLKDLWQQWRGILLAYDEGLIKGDAVLAAAVWRNMFKADLNADVADVAKVTAYIRSQLKALEKLSDEEITQGLVKFQSPRECLKGLLETLSPMMSTQPDKTITDQAVEGNKVAA